MIYTWFVYVYLSWGPNSIVGNVFAIIILGGGLLGILANFLFAIYLIITGVWKLITGQVPEPEKNTYDVSEAGEVEVYDFTGWWNAIGGLVFGIIAVQIGIVLIGFAIGPIPENVHTGTDDPIVLWGFAIICIIFSFIILISGVIGTVRGIYLLFTARGKRIG
ncbi:MAG: hypothetical protein ABJ275_07660 [Maricaulaceae bacterium]